MPNVQGEFNFEKPEPQQGHGQRSKRDRETAEKTYLKLLLRRLTDGVHEELTVGPRRDALVRYCMNVLMSLDWYQGAMRKMQAELEAKNKAALRFGIGAVLSVVALSCAVAFAKLPPLTEAQVTLFLMGGFYALRQYYSGTDYKSRLGSFWQASAALKANLYGLEESWRGKAVVDPRKNDLTDEFFEALRSALKDAQNILDTERKAFFGTFKNPSEVIGEALTSFKEMRAEGASFLKSADTAATLEREAAQKREAEVQAKVSAAQAVVAQQATVREIQFVIDKLHKQGDKGGKLGAYEEELFKAEAKLETLKARLADFPPH